VNSSILLRRCVFPPFSSPLPRSCSSLQVYDPSETRLLISHASPGREGLIRYGVSYNEFSVQHDPESFKGKLEAAKKSFNDVWEAVKGQVESVVECVFFLSLSFSFVPY
jgi:hypothetical protein